MEFFVAAPEGLPAGFAVVLAEEEAAEASELANEFADGQRRVGGAFAGLAEQADPLDRGDLVGGFVGGLLRGGAQLS